MQSAARNLFRPFRESSLEIVFLVMIAIGALGVLGLVVIS